MYHPPFVTGRVPFIIFQSATFIPVTIFGFINDKNQEPDKMRFYLTSPSLYIISFAGGRLKAAPQSESDRKIKARESTAELKQNLNITDKKILEQVYSIHLEAYRQLAEIEYLQQKDRRAYASRLWEIETWRYRLIGHLLDMKHISPIEQYMHNTWQKN